MINLEILAPGGGFNSSIHAFEAGADAVYVGLKSFSARQGATNFTLEQLRKLKTYASQHNKKIFVAINTVLKENELPEVIESLHHLSLIKIDALIIQDMGLAYIVKKFFPEMTLHASTQIAVHNSQGVDILKKAGFSKIILARELTMEEIKTIRNLHKDVELEVFIHGAMCYSVSGICLASGMLLGRSGNRGACGQICRTWFESDQGDKYQFSANDLQAGKLVRELSEIGVDSLKIEGRLKSPEYVSHTVSYYRSIIDEKSDNIIKEEETLSSLSFSRNQTSAFLKDPKGVNMINPDYASQTGILGGTILSKGKSRFTMISETDLSARDGLLILDKNGAQPFALKSDGKKNHYAKGEKIVVQYDGEVKEGMTVQKISGHNLQLKEFNEKSWKPWKCTLPLFVELKKKSIHVSTRLFNREITIKEPINLEKSTSGRSIVEILSQNFLKSGSSIFSAEVTGCKNSTDLKDNEIFISLPEIKAVKNSLYELLEKTLPTVIKEITESIINKINKKTNELERTPIEVFSIPLRQEMVCGSSMIPFIIEPINTDKNEIYYPLPPLLFNQKDFMRVENEIESISSNPGKKIIIGLNNISHLCFTEKYRERKNIFFFTDYCTYIANSAAALFYREKISRLLFSYYWIEDSEGSLNDLKVIEKNFTPHLFVSRICYKKHNGLGACKNCSKNLKYELKQRNKTFMVEVKDCITWLFQK